MTTRRSLIAIAAAAVVALSACSIELDAGDPITREFDDLPTFDTVRIDAPFQVSIHQGDRQTVQIEIPEGAVDDLVVESENGELLIDVDSSLRLLDRDDLIATITVVDLRAIVASGASSVVAPDLDVDTLDIAGSGASSVSISGDVDQLELTLSGASQADLTTTSITRATLEFSGASSGRFDGGTSEIEGSLSGASHLSVDEDTELRVDTSGASSIERE